MRIPLILILAYLFMASCNSYESAKNDKNDQSQINKEMIGQGFTRATIVSQPQESGCPIVIKTDAEFLDPINLEDAFKQDKLEVWVKFARLRRSNRCSMAAPVNITEIQKKAD